MPDESHATQPVRLAKFLSDAGVTSRRHAEEMILAGRVLVNDEVVNTLPAFVRPAEDAVMVDGSLVKAARLEYFIVHKPKGVVCTSNDPSGRPRALDLLPPGLPRMFPVGRLDMESAGLLIITNDGELAQRLTHPKYGVSKVYRAEVAGRVGPGLADELKQGVWLAEGKAVASDVRIVHVNPARSVLEITLREGPNRQVRRMLAHCGHPVRKLTRIEVGPISLKGLPLGAARRLFPNEVSQLERATSRSGTSSAAVPTSRKPRPARPKPSASAPVKSDSGSFQHGAPRPDRSRKSVARPDTSRSSSAPPRAEPSRSKSATPRRGSWTPGSNAATPRTRAPGRRGGQRIAKPTRRAGRRQSRRRGRS